MGLEWDLMRAAAPVFWLMSRIFELIVSLLAARDQRRVRDSRFRGLLLFCLFSQKRGGYPWWHRQYEGE